MKKNNGIISFISIVVSLCMLMPLPIDMYLPAFPTIQEKLDATASDVQMTFTVYLLGFSIGHFLFGYLVDRFGKKCILISGLIALSVSSIYCAWSDNIDQLITMRFVQGVSASAASVTINALVRDRFSNEMFSKVSSLIMCAAIISPLIAPFLGGFFLKYWGWESIFNVIAVLSLVLCFLTLFYLKEMARENKIQSVNLFFIDKKTIAHFLSMSFSYAGLFSYLGSAPYVYIISYKVPDYLLGLYLLPNTIALILIVSINVFFVERIGCSLFFLISVSLQCLSGFFLLFASLLSLELPFIMFGSAIFVGLIATVSSNGMAIALEKKPSQAGRISAFFCGGQFGMAAFVGIIQANLFTPGSITMVSSMLICSVFSLIFFLIYRR